MKSMKTIWAALCAVVMAFGFTACIPSSDNSDITAYITGYFDVINSGNQLQSTDGAKFTLSQALPTDKDGTIPGRVFARMEYNPSSTTDIDYSKYTFTVRYALPCLKMNLVMKDNQKEEYTSLNIISDIMMDGVLLNLSYQGPIPSDSKSADWYMVVNNVSGNIVNCSLQISVPEGVTTAISNLALYTPISSLLADYKQYAEDNKLIIRFNNREDQQVTYKYE